MVPDSRTRSTWKLGGEPPSPSLRGNSQTAVTSSHHGIGTTLILLVDSDTTSTTAALRAELRSDPGVIVSWNVPRYHQDPDRDPWPGIAVYRRKETRAERRHRVCRARTLAGFRVFRKHPPPALPAALYAKLTFVKRACGGQWRVRTP